MFATSHLYGNHIWMTQFSGVDQKIANFMKSINSKWLPIKMYTQNVKSMSYNISRTTNGRKLKFGYVAAIIILKSQTKIQQNLKLHG